jgi:cytoskeletal protein RodZ
MIHRELKYLSFARVYNMFSTKTKNTILLVLVSTTFILSVVSYAIPQQQAFGQGGLFQSQQESDSADRNNQSSSSSSSSSSSPMIATTTAADDDKEAEEDQKIVLGNITIPINSNTQFSLEMPDSKITIEPNK